MTQNDQEKMVNHLLLSYFHFSNGKLSEALTQIEQAKQLAERASDTRALIEVSLWHGEVCLRTAHWAVCKRGAFKYRQRRC